MHRMQKRQTPLLKISSRAPLFSPWQVQFGHAGALAGSAAQTADAKNAALKAAGAIVPDNFNDFVRRIDGLYRALLADGTIVRAAEPPAPKVPMDYAWAKSLGLVRKPAEFVSSISDDRGEELLYAGVPISKVFEEELGVGGVLSLLWFRRRLPPYATKFIEVRRKWDSAARRQRARTLAPPRPPPRVSPPPPRHAPHT